MNNEPTDMLADDDARMLDMAADKAILACGGDMRDTIKALILANGFLEDQMAKISYGYARGAIGMQEVS